MGVPPIMGTVQNLPCGPWDQVPAYRGRSDVVLYTSPPLDADLAITGALPSLPVRVPGPSSLLWVLAWNHTRVCVCASTRVGEG